MCHCVSLVEEKKVVFLSSQQLLIVFFSCNFFCRHDSICVFAKCHTECSDHRAGKFPGRRPLHFNSGLITSFNVASSLFTLIFCLVFICLWCVCVFIQKRNSLPASIYPTTFLPDCHLPRRSQVSIANFPTKTNQVSFFLFLFINDSLGPLISIHVPLFYQSLYQLNEKTPAGKNK